MINDTAIQAQLRSRFQNVDRVADGIYRTAESYGGRPFAIRYFDFTEHFLESGFERYQEHLLAPSYFRDDAPGDLRWNHYLYFVTDRTQDAAFEEIRLKLEADRSYARKIVLDQRGFESLVNEDQPAALDSKTPTTRSWTPELDATNLGFILDESIQVPEVVRMLRDGRTGRPVLSMATVSLTPAEQAASEHFLATLNLRTFRRFPLERHYTFGKVNLVSGRNGVGKTSLLEAIEYLYAGGHLRKRSGTASTSGKLFNTNFALESTTAAAALRERNLTWYAKRDKQKSTLVESFARFNYLDTDAAVRLSNDGDAKEINEAVARLVLGPEAETIKDRLKRIRDQTEAAIRELGSTSSHDRQRLDDARSKLELLRKRPQGSDGLFESLRSALADVMWRQALPAKTEVLVEHMGKDLQRASVAAELLARAGLAPADIPGRAGHRDQVQADAASVAILARETGNAAEAIFPIEQRLVRAQRAAGALAALGRYVESGYSVLRSARQALATSLTARKTRMERLDLRDVDLTSIGNATLAESIQMFGRDLARLRQKQEEGVRDVRAIEAALKASEAARQRLLQAAQQLLESDPDHCPVCRTRFGAGELAQKIAEDLSAADPRATLLGDRRKVVDESAHEITLVERQLIALRQLVEFLDGNAASTVHAALNAVSESAQQADSEAMQLAARESDLRALESSGLTASDLTSLLHSIPIDSEPSIGNLQLLQGDAATVIERERVALDQAKTANDELRAQLAVLASRYGLGSEASADEILGKIRSVLAQDEACVQAAQVLTDLMLDPSDTQRLALQLKGASESLTNFSTALFRETQAGSEIRAATEQVARLDAALKDNQEKIDRLSVSLKPIRTCSERFESHELVREVTAENAAEIARVFSAIHEPKDFTIRPMESGLQVIRNQEQMPAAIAEMSSGQRSAYALSLYLTMNARLSGGPPLLLLDDPIAHVDDLNVLSFLDHLRDLAVRGRRQIFFATASEKLAGLFRQKFRFLGDEDFRDIRLSRSA